MTQVDRRTARQFVADWWGFSYQRIHIMGVQTDLEGRAISIQFRIHSLARVKYLARRRDADSEWELIKLP